MHFRLSELKSTLMLFQFRMEFLLQVKSVMFVIKEVRQGNNNFAVQYFPENENSENK